MVEVAPENRRPSSCPDPPQLTQVCLPDPSQTGHLTRVPKDLPSPSHTMHRTAPRPPQKWQLSPLPPQPGIKPKPIRPIITAVRIRFDSDVAFMVRLRPTPGDRWEENPGGAAILTRQAAHLDSLLHWVLGFAHHAEVLDPPEFRSRVAAALRAMAEKHEDKKANQPCEGSSDLRKVQRGRQPCEGLSEPSQGAEKKAEGEP